MKTHLIFISIVMFNANIYSQKAPASNSDDGKCPYLHPTNKTAINNSPIVIDDFESAEATYKKWSNQMERGTMKSSIELSDSTQSGKMGAKISFTGTKSKGSWTNLQCKTTIPKDKNMITFWAKSEKTCIIKATIYQGLSHNELEIFGKMITIGNTWKKYEINITEFTEVVFSHPQQDGNLPSSNIKKEIVTGIGFAEGEFPVTFYLDNLSVN